MERASIGSREQKQFEKEHTIISKPLLREWKEFIRIRNSFFESCILNGQELTVEKIKKRIQKY